MTLKQLEAFYRAATCESFAIAAQRLHLSVSTLSKRISDLEEYLGQALFDRDHYRASLTSAGLAMLPKVSQLLKQADELRYLTLAEQGVQGNLRFAVGELASLTWLPRFMSVAAQRYPGLTLEPHVDVGQEMELGVQRGDLDFAIISGTSSRPNVDSHKIGTAQFCWVIAPSLKAQCSTVSEFASLALPLVTMPPGAGTYRMLEAWIQHNGVVWGKRLTCNTWGSVAALLLEGAGVGFLPRAWAEPLQQQGLLVVLEDWPALPSLYYSLQTRKDDIRLVMRVVRQLLDEEVNFALPIRFLAGNMQEPKHS